MNDDQGPREVTFVVTPFTQHQCGNQDPATEEGACDTMEVAVVMTPSFPTGAHLRLHGHRTEGRGRLTEAENCSTQGPR